MNTLRGISLMCLTLFVLLGMADGRVGQTNSTRGLWTVYTVANTSIASWHLTGIYEDTLGRMWFAAFDNGASMYDDGALITYNADNSAITARTTSFIHHPSGDVWVGTEEGIVVLDNDRWSRLDEDGALGLDDVLISALYIDSRERIWVGTWGEGLHVVVNGEWTSYRTEEGLPNDHIWTFYEDTSGHVWVGTQGGIVVFDSDDSRTVYTTNNSPLAENDVRVFQQDGTDTLYIGTYGGGINVLDADGQWQEDPFTTQQGTPSNFITSMAVQPQAEDSPKDPELLWVGTEAGLASFDGTAFSDPMRVRQGMLSHHFIKGLHVDDEGALWIVTYGGGVTIYNGGDDSYQYLFPTETGLAADDVYALLEDRQGNIWVGTSRGLSKFDGRAWETFIPDNSGLTYRYVNGLAEDKHGRVWISTLSGGSVYAHGEWITYDRFGENEGEQQLPSNSLFNVFYDSQDRVWFATGLGAAVLENDKWTLYNRTDGLRTNIISVVTEDSLGRVWLTHWQGINVFDNGVWNSINTQNAAIRTDLILASREDSQGRMWFGTIGDGVAIYDGQQWTKLNRANNRLSNDNVRSLAEEPKTGRQWVGTDGGLNGLINDELWMVYTAESTPLPANRINELMIDRHDNLWIGTAAGVAVFHPGSDFPLLDTATTLYPWQESARKDVGSRDQGDLNE